MELDRKLKVYYLTAIISMIFAVIGFSYNAWRLEVSEDNSNIRTASFEVLKELAGLEQTIYALHYDHDESEGSPRRAWVKVGLIVDLSVLISPEVTNKADKLKSLWGESWEHVRTSQAVTDKLIMEIDSVRSEIKLTLRSLT